MGTSYAIVSRLPSEHFQIALTVPLYLEYRDVLIRPENMTGASSRNDIVNFLRYLCSIAHQQNVFFLWRPRLGDTEDDMALEAAVASQSRYNVTHNLRHFLNLKRSSSHQRIDVIRSGFKETAEVPVVTLLSRLTKCWLSRFLRLPVIPTYAT